MSHHIAVCGVATPTGLYARCGDGWRLLEPTREPIAAGLTEVASEAVQADTTPTEQAKPLFAWSNETIGGHLDSSGKLRWNWSQSEQDWIRTGC